MAEEIDRRLERIENKTKGIANGKYCSINYLETIKWIT